MKVVTLFPGDGSFERALSSVLPGPTLGVGPSPGRPEAWPSAPEGMEFDVHAGQMMAKSATGGIDGLLALLRREDELVYGDLATVGEYTMDEFHRCRDQSRRPYHHAAAIWWLWTMKPKWFVFAFQSPRLAHAIVSHHAARQHYRMSTSGGDDYHLENNRMVLSTPFYVYGTSVGQDKPVRSLRGVLEIVKEVSARG